MSFYDFSAHTDPQQEDEHYMWLALQEAELAYVQEEIPIGAIVVSKGRIVGRGHNLTEQLNDVTAHAEMQAFTAAGQTLGGKYLKECTLYVTVEPCVMCAGAAYWTQIGTIVYGTSEEKCGYSNHKSNLLHPKTIVRKGVLSMQCTALMQRFFASKRLVKRKK